MPEERLKRQGQLAQDPDGSLVIIDGGGKAYKADNIIIAVWLKCDGKTVEEVVEDIAKDVAGVEKGTLKDAVQTIVTDLKKVNLLA